MASYSIIGLPLLTPTYISRRREEGERRKEEEEGSHLHHAAKTYRLSCVVKGRQLPSLFPFTPSSLSLTYLIMHACNWHAWQNRQSWSRQTAGQTGLRQDFLKLKTSLCAAPALHLLHGRRKLWHARTHLKPPE